MNVLLTLMVMAIAGLCMMALIPVLTVGVVLVGLGAGFLLWLLPILIIANSDQTTGGEKIAWILAIIFLSWFAWVFYFFLAPIKQKPRYY